MYNKFLKRILDIILSAIALVVLSPVLIIIAILVRVKIGSPVIFKQVRPGIKGKNGKEKLFTLYKFRTMTDLRDEDGNLFPDDDRMTRLGDKLRATSLDELPELWCILKGDMSIIGPRPQLVRDMVFMTEEQRKRHDVRPGLSGWAQVNGRNAIAWEDKLKFDLEYLEKQSLWMDIKIVLITVIKVIRTESISFEGRATAEDFGDYLLRTGKITKEEYDAKQIEAKALLGE